MNKQLVITGASQGIGYATAEVFLKAGWQVTNLSRHPCTVNGVHNITVDLLHPDAIPVIGAKLQKIVKNAEQVCLIHNAALMLKDHSDAIDASQLRQALELSVVVPSQLNKILIPQCAPGSSILYVGSTLSEKAVANTASYVTAKHATVGIMRATTQDLAGKGIHSACVCPGFTDTDMLRAHVGHDSAVLEQVAALSAFQRLVTPAEIAELLFYCATHPVINGAVLHANLGQLER